MSRNNERNSAMGKAQVLVFNWLYDTAVDNNKTDG
jgi:hypothetical protein